MGNTPETLDSLVGPGRIADSHQGWNGMYIYATDTRTGEVVINRGGDVQHDAASLSKLMTFYLTEEAVQNGRLSLDQKITIPANVPYSNVRRKDTMTVREAMGALMTASDNGVAVALAHAQGSDFVPRMNAKAKELGLNNDPATGTYFYNPNGLPKENTGDRHNNTTTARDMATLITAIHDTFPDAHNYMGLSSIQYGPHHQTFAAHHKLDKPDSPLRLPDGFEDITKTGYYKSGGAHRSPGAGYNSASVITGPDGRELTVVVLNAPYANNELARQDGLPESLTPKGGFARGDLRDALVGQIAQRVLGNAPGTTLVASTAVPQPAAGTDAGIPQPERVASNDVAPASAIGGIEHSHAAAPHIAPHVAPPAHHHPAHRGGAHHTRHNTALVDNLSPDHRQMLAEASGQFMGAIETGGTPSAPMGKNGAKRELG